MFDVLAVGIWAGLAIYVYNEVYKFVRNSAVAAFLAAAAASAVAYVGKVVS